MLTYAGSRIRAAHRPEPPLPGEDDPAPAPRAPISPAPPADMPVLEARVVSARPAAPTPVPADRVVPADPGPVEFVPSEPAEFVPRRRSNRPSSAHPSGDRERGWPTARPQHLDENADPAPAEDIDATLPVAPMTPRRRCRPAGASGHRATIS